MLSFGDSHWFSVISGVIPVSRVPYKLLSVSGLVDDERASVAISTLGSLLASLVDFTGDISCYYTSLDDRIQFRNVLDSCKQLGDEARKQLATKMIRNVRITLGPTILLRFY